MRNTCRTQKNARFVVEARARPNSPQAKRKKFSPAKNDSHSHRSGAQVQPNPAVSPPPSLSEPVASLSAHEIAGLVAPANDPVRAPALGLGDWFADEVHAHDASLKNFLRASFPRVHDVDDVVQESYLRLWKVRAAKPIRSAKAFLFTIAQHVALDFVRRERRSPIQAVGNLAELDVVEDRPAAAETLGRSEKIQLLIEAIDALPARCREVVILRKLRLVPQREVAARLGISEKGVENQLARGLERCRAFLRKRGVTDFFAG